ncbi:MAG: hypothetical protein OXJ53_00505, partial [Gammaproteobacteria bacterium]|nr:hypothetical protein [Gammaproteobacteria bacterium]
MNALKTTLVLAIAATLAACSPPEEQPEAPATEEAATPAAPPVIESNPNRNPYFGDLHVHTVYSF